MTLWAQGRYAIDGIREELRRHIDDADIFLSGDVFDTLDAQKK